MHDDVQYDPIQGQDQGHEPFKVGNPSIFKSYFLRHLQWELATDQWFLNYRAQYLNLFEPDAWYFSLVFVSNDSELGRDVSCEESTASPARGYNFRNFASPFLRPERLKLRTSDNDKRIEPGKCQSKHDNLKRVKWPKSRPQKGVVRVTRPLFKLWATVLYLEGVELGTLQIWCAYPTHLRSPWIAAAWWTHCLK